MFKELRKQIRLSEEAEVSASTGQEVNLDELNEDEEEVVDAEDKTLEEIVSLFEDEVLTMDAEDAERLMTEDDDEDEEESEEETLEEDAKDRDINRGLKLAVKAAKFVNKKEQSSKVKSVKHNVREATTEEVARLAKKRQIKTYLLFGLYDRHVSNKHNIGGKATVISVEVEYENGKKEIVVFAGITNAKPTDVKNKLESTLKTLKAGKQIKEDEDVESTEDGAKLDTLEEAYNFLFEDDSEEEEDSEEDLDKELEEMISFLEGDDEEADEVEEKEEEAKEKLAEALNAMRALKKAKRNRR